MLRTVDAARRSTANRVLGSLDAADLEALLHEAEAVELKQRQVLVPQDEPAAQLYFPLDGLYVLLRVMRSGRAAVTAMVSVDGVIGANAMLSEQPSPVEAVCYVPGAALKVPAESMRRHVVARPGVHAAVSTHIRRLLEQTQRNAGCNLLHDVQSRLARWLLTAQDCLKSPDLPLTQEMLSAILGVRRASVSKAAEALQGRGAIQYRHGHLAIINRRRLEAVACECYAATGWDNVGSAAEGPTPNRSRT